MLILFAEKYQQQCYHQKKSGLILRLNPGVKASIQVDE